MKELIKITIIASLVFAGYACTDLEEDLKGDFTEEFDPANPGLGQSGGGGSDDGLSPAYSRLLNGSAGHENYFSIQEVSTDEAVITQKGGDWFDGGIWLDMHRHQWQSTHPALRNAWNDTYAGISQCNLLLADAGKTALETAQLRTLRAYFYWRLMDLYGRVKIVTTSGTDAPQVTRVEVFNFIESELNAVMADLPTARTYARANRYAAQALLARIYLNAEVYSGTARWQDAIDACDDIINSGTYDLAPTYAEVFSPTNADNIEHIWAIPYDEATGTGMNFAQMTLHYPSQLTYQLQQQPWNGYSTLEEFYNSYDDADARKAASFIVGPQFDILGNPILDLAFDKADADGAPINYTPAINELAPNGSRQAGARMGKFSFKLKQLPEMDNDYPIFRYGEVLLNKAEATARLAGNWNDATTLMLVNQVRARNFTAGGTFASLTEDEFLAERGREMFQESARRTDLIRFGAWGDAWWEKPAHSNANLNVFPIPNDQILASQSETNKLTQNPGY